MPSTAGAVPLIPVLVQKVDEGAHLRQEQAVAQGEDAQGCGRPLKGFEHDLEPAVGEILRHLPRGHADQTHPRQRRTHQRIEIVGAKPGWNAQRAPHGLCDSLPVGEVHVSVPRGGAMLMRPLLLHASSKILAHTPRRVLHFVFAPAIPPDGLR